MATSRRLRPARQRATGVTLVELMVVLAIVAVLVVLALPSMNQLIERRRLEGSAQELLTDLRFARSHQLQSRPEQGTAVLFETTADKSCYVVYTRGSAGQQDCFCSRTPAQMCGSFNGPGAPVALRNVDIPLAGGTTLATNLTGSRKLIHFYGYNALPDQNIELVVTLSSASAGELRVQTNAVGMPSICSVSGAFGSITRCAPPPAPTP